MVRAKARFWFRPWIEMNKIDFRSFHISFDLKIANSNELAIVETQTTVRQHKQTRLINLKPLGKQTGQTWTSNVEPDRCYRLCWYLFVLHPEYLSCSLKTRFRSFFLHGWTKLESADRYDDWWPFSFNLYGAMVSETLERLWSYRIRQTQTHTKCTTMRNEICVPISSIVSNQIESKAIQSSIPFFTNLEIAKRSISFNCFKANVNGFLLFEVRSWYAPMR